MAENDAIAQGIVTMPLEEVASRLGLDAGLVSWALDNNLLEGHRDAEGGWHLDGAGVMDGQRPLREQFGDFADSAAATAAPAAGPTDSQENGPSRASQQNRGGGGAAVRQGDPSRPVGSPPGHAHDLSSHDQGEAAREGAAGDSTSRQAGPHFSHPEGLPHPDWRARLRELEEAAQAKDRLIADLARSVARMGEAAMDRLKKP